MSKQSEGKRGVDFWVLGNRSPTLHRYFIAANRCESASTSRLQTLADAFSEFFLREVPKL